MDRWRLFFPIDNLIGAAGNLQCFGVLLDKRVDVAYTLLLKDFFHCNEYARLLDVAEAVVDGGAEKFHRRREVHVGVHQRWNVIAQSTYFTVQNAIVLVKVLAVEKLLQFLLVSFNFQRFHRDNQAFFVVEILLQEVENHVASLTDVRGIHGHLAEEVLDVGLNNCQRP